MSHLDSRSAGSGSSAGGATATAEPSHCHRTEDAPSPITEGPIPHRAPTTSLASLPHPSPSPTPSLAVPREPHVGNFELLSGGLGISPPVVDDDVLDLRNEPLDAHDIAGQPLGVTNPASAINHHASAAVQTSSVAVTGTNAAAPGPETSVKTMTDAIVFDGMDAPTILVCLKYLGVSGLSNCHKQVKIQALSQRLLQLRISLDTVKQHASSLIELKEQVALALDEAEEPDASPEQKAEHSRLEDEEKRMASSVHERAANCRITGSQITDGEATNRRILQWKRNRRVELNAHLPVLIERDGLTYVNAFTVPPLVVSGLPSGSTGGERQPNFVANDHARLFHAMADPTMAEHRRRLCETRTRQEIDDGNYNPFEKFAELYNDANFSPVPVASYANGILACDVSGITPSNLVHDRDGACLQRHWNSVKSGYTIQLAKFRESGQNTPDSWTSFSNCTTVPSAVINYLHSFLNTPLGSVIMDMATRSIPDGVEREGGVNANGAPVATPASDRLRRRRAMRNDDRESLVQEISFVGAENFGRGEASAAIEAQELKQNKYEAFGKIRSLLRTAESELDDILDKDVSGKCEEYVARHTAKKRRLLEEVNHLQKEADDARGQF